MNYESLSHLSYPSGAAADLDDSVTFLRIANDTEPLFERPAAGSGSLRFYQMLYDAIHREVEEAQYAVARDDEGNITAAAIYSVVARRKFANLNILAVNQDQRGQGIGRGVLEFVTAQAARQGVELIQVVSTVAAYRFYLANGFEDIDEDVDDNPDSEYRTMKKDLNVDDISE